MTPDTEALRQEFERHIVATGRSEGELIFEAGHYLYPDVQEIWELYQAGYDAAKAETAAAVVAGPENDMQYLVDEFEKSLPPMGHPLRKLGVRLTELLDEDQWAECERLLLEGWEHDAADRATGARWRANYGEFAIEVAKLAVAAEREACAKACEEVDLHSGDHLKNSNPRVTCAAAIRAR